VIFFHPSIIISTQDPLTKLRQYVPIHSADAMQCDPCQSYITNIQSLSLLSTQLAGGVDDPVCQHGSIELLSLIEDASWRRLGMTHLTPKTFARAKSSILFLLETPRAKTAAYFWLCINSNSRSEALLTRSSLWPEGIRCLVFLLEP
jgi:hypothetical protein